MGKKIDALLGRTFKTAKFKALVNLAISRLAVLKNQRQIRCSQARSDVVQLLNLGHHERALLRVEQVIKEQNMLDVFVMMEGYCLLLVERVDLIEQERECPDELKEAISSLLYAASRCGDFPEIQEIRAVFTSRYGKEFAARAIELRNNCGVNHQMVQKLSTRLPSLENRMKVLKEIASENGIALQLEEPAPITAKEKLDGNQKQNQPEADPAANSGGAKLGDGFQVLPEVIEKEEGHSGSMNKKYRDVADAAQAAFESAAYAAAAARAAVELSRSSGPHDPDNHNSSNPRRRKASDRDEPMKSENEITGEEEPGEVQDAEVGLGFEKIPQNEDYHSETEEGIQNETQAQEFKQSKNTAELERSLSAVSSDSAEDMLNVSMMSSETKPLGKEIVFDDSDDENINKQIGIPLLKPHKLGFDMKPSLLNNADPRTRKSDSVRDEDLSEGSRVKLHYPSSSHKQIPTRLQTSTNVESGFHKPIVHSAGGSGIQGAQRLNIEKKPISVRTRRMHVH
ncbi:hypothetical protein L1049_006535 [Liquidambar formosana]|uniref:IST1-like protein n=1 Tax=Liquidambar formosana TaxID=63359 RepID=A0AAP0RFP3_LIQFO